MHKGVRLVVVIAVSVGVCIGSCLLTRAYNRYAFRAKVAQRTAPLEREVVADLCGKLVLPEEDWRCRPGASVYATDFYDSIGRSFEYGQSTYGDVQALLGDYQYECESREWAAATGYTQFRCSYDFHGNRVFPVIFAFELEDEILVDIIPVAFDSG